ncbi:hypothetical protein PK98_14490 [Croceibacterium mercuriale]|uniref:DUF6927 domain-containing protein n=1 Tax=Croceibacterium mercuriale TaxID=1572751 RepID=A0A0B2BS67_9SPHN|nr:hypothetical protein [Croceibacterium mercuriale]KHL24204.1 hypothetical protein PK98_14490 [Croceibacterium mercuriale]
MGWLSMPSSSMGGHKTPKAYLDTQLTYEPRQADDQEINGLRVLKSVWSGKTYYAAVESYTGAGEVLEVTAIVCLVRWNPNAADGFIFGYKDMSESMGPCEAECPASVLALLSSSDNPYKLNWRNRCYRNLRLAGRKLDDGAMIRFADPIEFTDGSKISEFRVRKEGRRMVLTSLNGYGRYRVGNLMKLAFEIVPERKPPKTFFG